MNTLKLILAIVIIAILAQLVVIGLEKSETVECLKLQVQSTEFPRYSDGTGFYITKWQEEMCRAHEIRIDAVVL